MRSFGGCAFLGVDEVSINLGVGDCGFGFHKQSYYDTLYQRKMHRKFSIANVLLLMGRGNHDDPSYFAENKIDYLFLKGVADYTIIQSPQGNILCVG